MKDILLYWFKIQASKSAQRELIKHYNAGTVKQILSSYWQRYQKFKPEVPVMPTLGGYVTVHLAALQLLSTTNWRPGDKMKKRSLNCFMI
jgi:hypothetical protein